MSEQMTQMADNFIFLSDALFMTLIVIFIIACYVGVIESRVKRLDAQVEELSRLENRR